MVNLDLRHSAELLRVLAHPTRLAILGELKDGPKCVSDINELLDVSQPNLSQHLAVLRRERIVDFYEERLEIREEIVMGARFMTLRFKVKTEDKGKGVLNEHTDRSQPKSI